jgi:hypothetical protein
VLLAEHHEVIQALPTHRPHPALRSKSGFGQTRRGMSVRPRRAAFRGPLGTPGTLTSFGHHNSLLAKRLWNASRKHLVLP